MLVADEFLFAAGILYVTQNRLVSTNFLFILELIYFLGIIIYNAAKALLRVLADNER